MSRWTPEKVAELLRRADAATIRADELVAGARDTVARADDTSSGSARSRVARAASPIAAGQPLRSRDGATGSQGRHR